MHPLNVFELRNYVMQPGKRDVLIDMFEREFIESQEVLGSRVAASFCNLDNPDRFVWLRGFESMETRAKALDGFYSGALWQGLRNEANATMIDSDDVLLLRPVSGVAWARGERAPIGATAIPQSMIVCATYFLRPGGDAAFASFFAGEIAPALRDRGAEITATLATEHSPNSYPRLPVRENETVFVALLRFPADARTPDVASLPAGADQTAAPQVLRLRPTARSALK